MQYRDKFYLRLNAFNLLHLNQLIYVIGKFITMLGNVYIVIVINKMK